MLIDVIDLNFETLNFKRRYDSVRYKRGRNIYNYENVSIEKVDKLDNNNYIVEALVQGNYDIYKTKLNISNLVIDNCTCTCEDFYKGNLCKHIIATYLEVLEPHNASTIEGRKRLQKKRIEEIEKRQQEERKKREYEAKYRYGMETIELYKPENNYSKDYQEDNIDIYDIYRRNQLKKGNQKEELATSIRLEPKLEYKDDDTLGLTFKIGTKKMYILKNISSFYEAYKNQEKLVYGKQLCFIPNKENFTEDSKKFFDFIIKYANIIAYNKKFNRYGLSDFSDKEIYIMGNNIEETLNLFENPKVYINSYRDGEKEYYFTDDKLEIQCEVKKEEVSFENNYWFEIDDSEEFVLKLNIKNYNVLYSDQYIYIFHKNKIYKMQKEKEIVKLFKVFKHHDRILIPEDRLKDFGKFVVPNMKFINADNLPKEIVLQGEVVNTLASKILLDVNEEGDILLELKFCYLDTEFNPLERNYINNIIRDNNAEIEVINRLFNDGFELEIGSNFFILKNENDIYDFLCYKIENYMQDYEVLATDKFKSKQIKQPKISNIGVRVDNGLLEIDISKINIDIGEIKDILKDYKIKKKYHKLKNGDFLSIENSDDLELLEEMTTALDVDFTKIENGKIELPVNRSIYIDKLIDSSKNINITKNKKFTSIIDGFYNKSDKDIEIDEDFQKILRDYQKSGYRWLKNIETYKFGGVLADDMGLGKTLQIISLLKSQINYKTTSIVVCPSTLVLNWKAEVEKWCDSLKVLIINGTVEERVKKINQIENYNLIVTSYDLLKRDIKNYEDKYFKYIIADEAQYIKNYSTQNATSLKKLKGEVKYALTGTPIENSVAELWSIFDFIMPGYLYNYNKFKKKFEEPILKQENKEALLRLKKLIAPFVLRRVKKDVLTELPEKNITIMKNEMDYEQQKIYLSYLAQTKKEVAEELSGNSFEKSKFKILMLLTRLRQICCHPSLFIENYKGYSGKLEQCLDLINEAIQGNHKILLFSSYTSMFEIIEKELEKLEIKYFKLVGETPVDKRIKMVDEFNNSEDVKVFLISLKAGGTGLNLTSADVVIHYDPWWNVSIENQATDRAYRIGQKNSVQVYKLITSNSIEEKINKMQERKEKLSKDILSTEETFISKMSAEEILDLFT